MRKSCIALTLIVASGCTQSRHLEAPVEPDGEPAEAPPEPSPSHTLSAETPVRLSPLSAVAQTLRDASALAEVQEWDRALALLKGRNDPAARYLRATILRARGEPRAAAAQLAELEAPEPLASWVVLERSLVDLELGDERSALRRLDAIWGSAPALDRKAALPLARLRAAHDPGSLWRDRERLEAALDPKDPDARSALYGALLRSLELHPQPEHETEALALARYLEEPVSTLTPSEPPRALQPAERIERAESLLEAHRNERVKVELEPIVAEELPAELACRRDFTYGFAARKLRHYRTARRFLGRVVEGECDEDLRRRAHFLWAKVISIAAGLAAIEPIEAFARDFAGHTMVDDVYFWAGDMYQRRGRRAEAQAYYEKIQAMQPPGDQCAIARWRLAWMSYDAAEWKKAEERLERLLADDGCVNDAFERARATYWLGRVAEKTGHPSAALAHYGAILKLDPLGWYAQLALVRVRDLDSERFTAIAPTAPQPSAPPALCPGELAGDPSFMRGWQLREMGLVGPASAEWLSVDVSERAVLSGAHAAALARDAQPLEVKASKALERACTPDHPGLLLALGLSSVGEKAEAQWRLRTTHAEYLARAPSAESAGLWFAAYPLEARASIAPAEKESKIPELFLQALAREESAFDDQIVSWAGAYGLTQLLLSTGQTAGRLLDPPVLITRSEQLLEPRLNARLGAAYLGRLLERYAGHPALALAAYNAGEGVADTWWRRHAGDDLDYFAEAMTIKETRGYVKRVLRTFGIYRWLYTDEPAVLPVPPKIPPQGGGASASR